MSKGVSFAGCPAAKSASEDFLQQSFHIAGIREITLRTEAVYELGQESSRPIVFSKVIASRSDKSHLRGQGSRKGRGPDAASRMGLNVVQQTRRRPMDARECRQSDEIRRTGPC